MAGSKRLPFLITNDVNHDENIDNMHVFVASY